MFKALYSANRDINHQIDGLNKQYLELLRNSQVDQLSFDCLDSKHNATKQNIKDQIKNLEKINTEYQQFRETNHQLKSEISEAKVIADSVEKLLEELIASLEISEDQRQDFDLDLSTLKIEELDNNQEESDPDEDKENSQIEQYQEEQENNEAEDSSDKENSTFEQQQHHQDKINLDNSDNFFSPTISFAKVTESGIACFTPASRSSHKNRLKETKKY